MATRWWHHARERRPGRPAGAAAPPQHAAAGGRGHRQLLAGRRCRRHRTRRCAQPGPAAVAAGGADERVPAQRRRARRRGRATAGRPTARARGRRWPRHRRGSAGGWRGHGVECTCARAVSGARWAFPTAMVAAPASRWISRWPTARAEDGTCCDRVAAGTRTGLRSIADRSPCPVPASPRAVGLRFPRAGAPACVADNAIRLPPPRSTP